MRTCCIIRRWCLFFHAEHDIKRVFYYFMLGCKIWPKNRSIRPVFGKMLPKFGMPNLVITRPNSRVSRPLFGKMRPKFGLANFINNRPNSRVIRPTIQPMRPHFGEVGFPCSWSPQTRIRPNFGRILPNFFEFGGFGGFQMFWCRRICKPWSRLPGRLFEST